MLQWLKRFLSYEQGKKYGLVTDSTFAGVHVDEVKALNLSAVWCAVRVISEAVASLPLTLYRRLPQGGKERALEHPLYGLLHNTPNPEQTAFVFRETLQSHVLLWGNAYAEIERNEAGRPVALWPLPPNRVKVARDQGELVYLVRTDAGEARLGPESILHVPGLGFDGCIGYSPISLARESLGLTLATEHFGASFFGNASRPSGVLEYPGKLSDNARENLRQSWNKLYTGEGNTGRIAILEEGLKFAQLQIPPEDGQFLQTRQFQIQEIARWFNVPPHKLKALDRATWGNIESENISFVQDTLRPWLVKWEQEVNRKLLMPSEQVTFFAEHLIDALLRGDTQTRYQAYAIAIQNGWMTRNEVREKENMNPLPELDQPMTPLNMQVGENGNQSNPNPDSNEPAQ